MPPCFADEFQAQAKVYSGSMRLGEMTPSYDMESEVEQTAPWQHITGVCVCVCILHGVLGYEQCSQLSINAESQPRVAI